MEDEQLEWATCRRCGSTRHHVRGRHKTTTRDGAPFRCGEIWEILQCAGCDQVSARLRSWVAWDHDQSEQSAYDDQYFPPLANRREPQWLAEAFYQEFPLSDFWAMDILGGVYDALALRHNALAAMGTRAIVDHLVTTRSRVDGSIPQKLKALVADKQLDEEFAELIRIAFDAGSAAAHRAHKPDEESVQTLLDIAERLMSLWLIEPVERREQRERAKRVEATTPKRPRKTKG